MHSGEEAAGAPTWPAATGVRSQSHSTERAMSLLACFTAEQSRQRVSDLAERVGLHPSSVYRYMLALEAAGLVERDAQIGGYKLGLGVVELSAIVLQELDIRRHALEEMDRLRDETGLLVNLGMRRGGNVIHVAHAFPQGWPVWNMVLGRSALANCTALGKVLLASLAWPDALRAVESTGWKGYTEHSLTDAAALRPELELTAERGYAVDREERALGTTCVAVPVRGPSGDVEAALSMTARSGRIAEIGIEGCVDLLTAAASRIASHLSSKDSLIAYL